MKTLPLLLLGILVMASCHPNRVIHNILSDQSRRAKMYHEILKNDSYRVQLIDSLRTNQHTRLMFLSNEPNNLPKGEKNND